MPGVLELVATSCIILVAGIVTGTAGFGFALFAVPLLLFMHEPSTVVAMVNVLGVCSGIVITATEWRDVHRQTLRSLIPWSIGGLLVGAVLLRVIDDLYIKLLASFVVVAFSIHAALRLPFPGIGRPEAVAVAGLSSGALGITTGLTGPPVALLFSARDMSPTTFRVTITTYFIVTSFIAILVLVATRHMHRGDLLYALAMLPAALLGRLIGRRIALRISPEMFRGVVVGTLLLTGASGAVSAIATII
jgi:uncharacterized membrane protein YfcA